MASQVTSGYSTEGTQYATDNSYYLLDTLSGSGSTILGPVTVSGNITVTGTTTLQGAAGALSLNTNTITANGPAATYSSAGKLAVSTASTAADSLTLTSAGGASLSAAAGPVTVSTAGVNPLNLSSPAGPVVMTCGPAHAVTVQGGAMSLLAQGPVALNSATSGITINSQLNSQLTSSAGSVAVLGAGGGILCQSAATAASSGAGVELVNSSLALGRGVQLYPSMGTFAAPALATQVGPGHTFGITGNKAFITTGGASATLIISPPPFGGTQWIAVVGQIGNTPTNVASVVQNGGSIICTPSNILAPMTVYVLIL